jgi:tRNA pseudouridine38-40 synthase
MDKSTSTTCRRIALKIQYDGTNFSGYQVQDTGRTVQGDIENALLILTKEKCRIIASGRTDTGVHALGQIAHFDTNSDLSLDRLCISLNGILDRDISIVNAFDVPNDFHARFSAVEREYKYFIYNAPQRTPFMMHRAMWMNKPIDIKFIKKALNHLIGEHDFATFCKKISSDNGTIRRINSIKVIKNDNLIEITINGNAFLHNMIRIIIGTTMDLVKNNQKHDEMKKILNYKNRDYGGITAPPYGLYLNRIYYKPRLSSYNSAFKD